jgi:hypothetical protein
MTFPPGSTFKLPESTAMFLSLKKVRQNEMAFLFVSTSKNTASTAMFPSLQYDPREWNVSSWLGFRNYCMLCLCSCLLKVFDYVDMSFPSGSTFQNVEMSVDGSVFLKSATEHRMFISAQLRFKNVVQLRHVSGSLK